jgi:hypothetical protein
VIAITQLALRQQPIVAIRPGKRQRDAIRNVRFNSLQPSPSPKYRSVADHLVKGHIDPDLHYEIGSMNGR